VTTEKRELTTVQKVVLGLALVPMVAVGIAGGIGTYGNISGRYGSDTAVGALAAGEGATAVLAFILLGVTLLGQRAPRVVRLGLWLLPAAAAVMGATAATETGQRIVYALTPMAITAAAEGVAFLARRIVIHQEGHDIEAETRAAHVVRDLAYHQARANGHPSRVAKWVSVRRSWRLARKVGQDDAALGTQLLDIQRNRLSQGADAALGRMFTPALSAPAAPALTASADAIPALPAVSADGVVTPHSHDATIQADTSGYPSDTAPEQAEEAQNVRPDLQIVRTEKEKRTSMAADVRQMVADGVQDVRHVVDAIATRHGRQADDPRLKSTVAKYVRAAKADAETKDDNRTGQYL
jgi:hypothetical protein